MVFGKTQSFDSFVPSHRPVPPPPGSLDSPHPPGSDPLRPRPTGSGRNHNDPTVLVSTPDASRSVSRTCLRKGKGGVTEPVTSIGSRHLPEDLPVLGTFVFWFTLHTRTHVLTHTHSHSHSLLPPLLGTESGSRVVPDTRYLPVFGALRSVRVGGEKLYLPSLNYPNEWVPRGSSFTRTVIPAIPPRLCVGTHTHTDTHTLILSCIFTYSHLHSYVLTYTHS